jgi:hypothetical protein
VRPARPAYKSRKTLPSAFEQMMAVLPSLAVKRDRSGENLFSAGNIFKLS